jgi:hypothetical protein
MGIYAVSVALAKGLILDTKGCEGSCFVVREFGPVEHIGAEVQVGGIEEVSMPRTGQQ